MLATAVSLAALWVPLAALVLSVVTYGVRRDRGRPTRSAAVVAGACSLVLLTTCGAVAWVADQQRQAERDVCQPSGDC